MGQIGDRRGQQGGLSHLQSSLQNRWTGPPLENTEWREFLIDGSSLTLNNWSTQVINDLAAMVGEAHEEAVNGVVVIAESQLIVPVAASLAYQFEGLRKPIVFTGSVRTMDQARTDAVENFTDAVSFAQYSGVLPSVPRIPEVIISSHRNIWRAAEARHVSVSGYDQFGSSHHEPIAEHLGDVRGFVVQVNRATEIIRWPADEQRFQIHELDTTKSVTAISTASIDESIIMSSLQIAAESSDGLVVNYPLGSDGPLVRIAQAFPELPIICHGKVSEDLPNLIPMNGDHLDNSATIAKLHYILSRTSDLRAVRALYLANLRGERQGKIDSERAIMRRFENAIEPRLRPMR